VNLIIYEIFFSEAKLTIQSSGLYVHDSFQFPSKLFTLLEFALPPGDLTV